MRFLARSLRSDDDSRLADRRGDRYLPADIGVFLRKRDGADGLLARRHAAAGKAGQSRRCHRQPADGDARAAPRRDPVRQQFHQYRRIDFGDGSVARLFRSDRRDLRHAGDDASDFHLCRSVAEDGRLQCAGSHGARGGAAGRADRALVLAVPSRRRVAGARHIARARHADRQNPVDPVAGRRIARRRRSHASRRRRGKNRPRHDGRPARSARAHGFGRHDPSHQDGDARCRRAAARPDRRRFGCRCHANTVVAQFPG